MGARYVVTGTDTDVGKTVAAAGLARSLGARYWKPVQAGLDGGTDSDTVRRLTEGKVDILPEAYRLTTPCSPHEAARIDRVTIDPARLALPPGDGALIVEGAGGALVPFSDTLLAADLFAMWGLPAILVARTTLGTINHTLLSIEALRARGIAIAGVLFSGDRVDHAEQAIVRFGNVAHLGRIPRLDPLDAGTLEAACADHVRLDLLA